MSADKKWVGFHNRNVQKVRDGTWSWWKRDPYNFKRKDGKIVRVEPKWHLLTAVESVGERGDAQYTAACGYKYVFKRVYIEKPRSVIRKPKLAELCINCSHGKL